MFNKKAKKARTKEYYSKELTLPEAFVEWILMCCYEPNGLDGWIRWYDVGYKEERDEKIYTTKELFKQFKDFSEEWAEGKAKEIKTIEEAQFKNLKNHLKTYKNNEFFDWQYDPYNVSGVYRIVSNLTIPALKECMSIE